MAAQQDDDLQAICQRLAAVSTELGNLDPGGQLLIGQSCKIADRVREITALRRIIERMLSR